MTRRQYVTQIISACEDAFDVPRGSVLTMKRVKPVLNARRVAFLAASRLTDGSPPEIASWFMSDRKTVTNSVKAAERLMVLDPEFANSAAKAFEILAVRELIA